VFAVTEAHALLDKAEADEKLPLVLVVEDNQLNMEMACELLESAGFKTLRAEEGATALALAQQTQPDVVLIDLHLPNMDGFEVAQQLKLLPAMADVPLVAFTAMVMKGDRERAIAAGCEGYIAKPIDVRQFANTVRSYLRRPSVAALTPGEAPALLQAPPVATVPSHNHSVSPATYTLPWQALSGMAFPLSHNVMVVDDNVLNVELLKEALESMQQHVVAVYNGRQAVRLATQHPPDLILLDIMMPEMDGYEVLAQLKQHPQTEHIPVIFVSALDKTKDIVRGFSLGTYDYIPKPFKTDEFKARVIAALRMKDLQDALTLQRDLWTNLFRYTADGMVVLNTRFEVMFANPVFSHWLGLWHGGGHETQQIFPPPAHRILQQPPPGQMGVSSCSCSLGYYPEGLALTDLFAGSETSLGPNGLQTWLDQLDCVDPQPADAVVTAVKTTNAQPAGPRSTLELVFKKDENEIRFFSIRGSCLPAVGRTPPGYLLVIRDITEEKRLQDRKETFVATLTHDLKTPIRAEARALDLLINGQFGPLAAVQQEVLREVLASNQYMYQMVDGLLSTYKYEDGRVVLNLDALDLNRLIREQVWADMSRLAEDKHQHLHWDLAPQLPRVWADALEIKRVLNNLIQNAVAYTPEAGSITVKTFLKPPTTTTAMAPIPPVSLPSRGAGPLEATPSFIDSSPGAEVCLCVADTGRGIEPEVRASLFSRYSSTAKRFRHVGTGLGLYLSRQIVEAHGGKIWVDSEMGRGSQFYVTLPLATPSLPRMSRDIAA
jgi:CheY-like chemotaxis protein